MSPKKISLFLGVCFVIGIIFGFAPKAFADVATWQKGVVIVPRSTTGFDSLTFRQSVDNLAVTHANYVTLIAPYYQSNLYATDIAPGWNTPDDASLVSAINYIHSKGLLVMLQPHVDPYTGEWRADINPGDRATWYANYAKILAHLAQLAGSTRVEEFSVGAELVKMAAATENPDNTRQWVNLINQVRAVYDGKLTYSANWGPPSGFPDEKNHIGFWSNLDFAGISAYYSLDQAPDNSPASLEKEWDRWNKADITPLQVKIGKPIVFTEVGYKSTGWAHGRPWDFNLNNGADLTEQANDYTALFDYWSKQNFMQGVQLWNWSSDPNTGGSGDPDYTPQNKPAQAVMAQWFAAKPRTNETTQNPATNQFTNLNASAASSISAWPPGTLVLDRGTIYLISGQSKIGFATMKAFRALGYSLKNVIKGDASAYQLSPTVLSSASQAHPKGSWILDKKTVYYVSQDGLIPVSSWQIFLNNGGQAKFLTKANIADLKLTKLGLMQTGDQRI